MNDFFESGYRDEKNQGVMKGGKTRLVERKQGDAVSKQELPPVDSSLNLHPTALLASLQYEAYSTHETHFTTGGPIYPFILKYSAQPAL